MIKINNLVSGYGKMKVLKNVSIHVSKGEIVTLIGANGAGKTTLLNTIAGIIKVMNGTIEFDSADITHLASDKIVSKRCMLVPEGRQVFATMTVYENLILGAYTQYKEKRNKEVLEDLEYIYKNFPVLEARKEQLAGTLSGGEQQMLAIARALMGRPKLLMLDEPSMGLAPLIVKDIFSIITKLRDEGKTILLVEQNAKAALGIADRGYVIETGQIVSVGSADDLNNNADVQRAYLGKEYSSKGE